MPSCRQGTFDDLPTPLLVNTVDLERGAPVIWGSPGLRDVSVQDAVYASCALPGYFPPGHVDDRLCVDGGVIDNLPVGIASLDADLVIAVDVGSSDLSPINDAISLGFANIYMRAATTMMHALQQFPLTNWNGPPMVLIRPRCGEDWLSFNNIAADDQGRTSRGAQSARGHRRVLRPAGRRLSAPPLRARASIRRSASAADCASRSRRASWALDAQGKAYPRIAHRRLVAGRWRVRAVVSDARDLARKIERIVPMKAGERGVA